MIVVKGARTHNLKNISVELPHNKLIVITGLSGSGKSSLAFDTLYAEGQRRYVESLSAYARQFLDLMEKPDVDSIDGLRPAIAIEQKTTSKNPRSTVGTITEIYDYLRLLFARIGVPHSPVTGLPIASQTVSQMVDRIALIPGKTKCLLLAPFVRKRKGEHLKELQELKRRGFQRFKIDDIIYDATQLPKLNPRQTHSISVVVDRFSIPEDIDEEWLRRIAASLETALDLSNGIVDLESFEGTHLLTFSSKFSCPVSGFTLKEIEPRLFSFNSPQGACPTCAGLGTKEDFDLSKIVTQPTRSLEKGAIPALDILEKISHITPDFISNQLNFKGSTPFEALPEHTQNYIIYGSSDRSLNPIKKLGKKFEGILPSLMYCVEEMFDGMNVWLRMLKSDIPCPSCYGMRLKEEALCVKIQNRHIGQICALSIEEALKWFEDLSLTSQHQAIGERVLTEIRARLGFLKDVGLDYLTLSRVAGTLSGGESQRIRLASQIGSGLTGVLYVLDEPSIGLHQRDNDRLLLTLKKLRNLGNTVVVVEHDEDAIRMADLVLDMGPEAGTKGGHIVACGTPKQIEAHPESLTGQYLSGVKKVNVPQKRRGSENYLLLKDARLNNLKGVQLKIPVGVFTCVTGVSGSGKSSLIMETLYPVLSRCLMTRKKHDTLEGTEWVDKVIEIDQSPIGRTPRSNPCTYIGCFTAIREWFSALPESKARGYAPGRFSFNVQGGRCEACHGDGIVRIEMHFLPDVYVKCEQCHGRRYNRETLDIRYNGKNIADILDMTVSEAIEFFTAQYGICEKLKCLEKVGLGYIHVGQQATSLSGGEAQRVKIAKEITKRSTGKTVYILDEPTTGLHFEDVRKLLEILHYLADQGNTVIVIEHNLDVIKTADWIIDIGPEGGEKGGLIVGEGTPETIAKIKNSYTGKYLKKVLKE